MNTEPTKQYEDIAAHVPPYEIVVVTKIPDPQTDDGNLCCPIVYRLEERVTMHCMIYGRVEVFALGEILILDSAYGRELAGRGRKPSKWSVSVDCFGVDMHAALARAVAVSRETPPQEIPQ